MANKGYVTKVHALLDCDFSLEMNYDGCYTTFEL